MGTACSSVTMEADDEQVMKLQADDAVINLMIQCGVSASLFSMKNATEVAYECRICRNETIERRSECFWTCSTARKSP